MENRNWFNIPNGDESFSLDLGSVDWMFKESDMLQMLSLSAILYIQVIGGLLLKQESWRCLINWMFSKKLLTDVGQEFRPIGF